MSIRDDGSWLPESDLIADGIVAFFRFTRTVIAVIDMTVIKRMSTERAPIQTPNTRPLTANELVNEAPVTEIKETLN